MEILQIVQIVQMYAPHLIFGTLLLALLYYAHQSSDSTFNAFDYFIDPVTGKASITRTLQLIAGLTATWVVVKLTVNDKITYDMFGIYLIAVGASEAWTKYVAAKFLAKDPSTDDTTKAEK